MYKRIYEIDLLKTMAMIGVICFHTLPIYDLSSLYSTAGTIFYKLSAFCIPTFFICTGYLLAGKKIDWPYIKKKTLNIIKFIVLYVILVDAIGFIYHLIIGQKDYIGDGSFWSYIKITLNDIVSVPLQKGNCQGLWFLISLILIYWLMYLINKILLNKRRKIIAIVL